MIGVADAASVTTRACLYRHHGYIGEDVVERVASDVAHVFYQGPMCARDAERLRRDSMVIVEDLAE